VAHLHAVPDPDDDPVEEAVDPAAAVAPDEESEAELLAPAESSAIEEEPRRYPSTIGGAFYLSILVVAAVAMVIAVRTDWRLGIQLLGGALLIGAILRLLLANRDAGMLAVRNRFIDVVLLTGAGVGLLVLASSIPPQPPI
jgi:hypothetical protein